MIERFRISRPLLAIGLLLVLGGPIVAMSSIMQAAIHEQWGRVTRMKHLLETDPQGYCVEAGMAPSSDPCADFLRQESDDVALYAQETIHRFPLIGAHQSLVGLGGTVAGFAATAPGAMVAFALSSAYTASEWSRGTIGPLLARDPRRARFVAIRSLVTWAEVVAIMLAVWAILACAIPLMRLVYELPPSPASLNMTDFAVRQMPRAILALGAWSALATGVALFARSALTTILVGVSVIAMSLALSGVEATYRFTPAYVVGSWMDLSQPNAMVDHLWTNAFPGPPLSSAASGLILAGSTVLVLGVAISVFRRSPVPA